MSITYTTTGPAGERITWRDRKRYAWALSVLWPLLPFTGLAAHHASGSEWALALPLLISYGLMPLADALIGEDENNPPEAVVGALDADRYYRWLTWATVPLHFVALIGCAWWAGTHDLSWPALLLLAYVARCRSRPRVLAGTRTAHAAGKYRTAGRARPGLTATVLWSAWLARLVPAYGHFTVSTAAATTAGWPRPRTTPARAWASRSTASMRDGRAAHCSLGGIRRAWALEGARWRTAARRRLRTCAPAMLVAWSWHNTMLQSIMRGDAVVCCQAGPRPCEPRRARWRMLRLVRRCRCPPCITSSAWWPQSTSANCVQHVTPRSDFAGARRGSLGPRRSAHSSGTGTWRAPGDEPTSAPAAPFAWNCSGQAATTGSRPSVSALPSPMRARHRSTGPAS
ncbi:MAG: hypothetical protein U1F67_02565 [Rubrivivax sp.]